MRSNTLDLSCAPSQRGRGQHCRSAIIANSHLFEGGCTSEQHIHDYPYGSHFCLKNTAAVWKTKILVDEEVGHIPFAGMSREKKQPGVGSCAISLALDIAEDFRTSIPGTVNMYNFSEFNSNFTAKVKSQKRKA